MNIIERRYRSIVLMERIQQLEGELVVLQSGLREGPEKDRYVATGRLLVRASEQIQDRPTPKSNLETALRLSIQLVKDRKLCEDVSRGPEGA